MIFNRSFKTIIIFLLGLIVFYYIENEQNFMNKYEKVIENLHNIRLNSKLRSNVEKKPIRIFCMILTDPSHFDSKTKIVNKTWAQDCDKYFFIAKLNNSLPANLTYEFNNPYPILQPAGYQTEAYSKLTEKIYKAIIAIYKKYDDYDWYFKADDDTFVFVDNLREFLETKNSSEPLTYGYNYKIDYAPRGYQSGGSGYVLGNDAFKRLGSVLSSNYSYCPLGYYEDVEIAKCLRMLGVEMGTSIDEKKRERFHVLNINTHIKGTYDNWIYNFAQNEVKSGTECCSEQTISFHWMKPDQIEKLYNLWTKLKNETQKPYNVTPIMFQLVYDKN